ncbi:MAG: acylphosphatase [Isosphaeraceae bacterium]
MPLERRRVLYSGRVQGVGFRATCRWLAGGFELVGYVRNLPDGRVEVVAEGDSAEIDQYLEMVREQMSGFIRNIDIEPEPSGFPPLQGFSVRF